MQISIVIVSFNTQELTMKCLTSIYEYTKDVTFEVIVVDNNSQDDSVKLIKQRFENVQLIECDTNLGFSKANNLAVKKAKGQYIALINSDIELTENTFYKLYGIMEEDTSIGIAGPKTVDKNGGFDVTVAKIPSLWNTFCDAFYFHRVFSSVKFCGSTLCILPDTNRFYVEVMYGCFWFIRKTALDDVGLLDESFFFYAEDIDFSKRFYLKKWNILYCMDLSVIHYGAASTKKQTNKFSKQMEKADLQYWKKHHTFFQVSIYVVLKVIYHVIGTFLWLPYLFKNKEISMNARNKIKSKLIKARYLMFRS